MTQHTPTATKTETIAPAQQISQDEYDRLRAHGYAGTRQELTFPEKWQTTHWVITNGSGGTSLLAVTIAN